MAKKKNKKTTRQAYGVTVLKAAHPMVRARKREHAPGIHGNKFWNSSWCVMDFLAHQGLPAEIQENDAVQQAYLGGSVEAAHA